MYSIVRGSSMALVLMASTTLAQAEETVLFNGKNLDGWSFHVRDNEKVKDVEQAWVVQEGLLVATGRSTSYLRHKTEFENYLLTLEWRSMLARNGLIIGGVGSVLIHTSDEEGAFRYPKSVEVSLRDIGAVYLRDINVRAQNPKEWAFRAPDFADEAEKDLGEWNQLKLICRGNRLTILVNGTPVNQIEELNREKGSVALRATSGAPLYYRNIKVQPLTDQHAKEEQTATQKLAELKALSEKKEAAREAQRRAEELKEKAKAEAFEKQWATITVAQDIDFQPDARRLPFPKDTQQLRFRSGFGFVELTSATSLPALSKWYRTEMARRGWKETEKERDEDSVEVTFQNGQAKVEMQLRQKSKGVEARLTCKGLSFDGTDDPAGLVALGIPQPPAYVFLQKEFKLPENVQGLEFDSGNRCLFKCTLGLQEAFHELTGQLKAKGYRETRRPIVSDNRRYTEFAKGRAKVSVNIFSDKVGSRAVLTYEAK